MKLVDFYYLTQMLQYCDQISFIYLMLILKAFIQISYKSDELPKLTYRLSSKI